MDDLGYRNKTFSPIYDISKTALTQIDACESSIAKNLLVLSITPGFYATDMTKHASDARSPEIGADSILHAINTPQNELQNGGFYRDGKQLPLISQSIPTS